MKHGFKVMDSDIHVQEPRDLWARYIEPQFKDRAPQFTNIPDGSSPGVWRFEGKVFPAYIDRPERQRLAKVRRHKAHDRHEELGRDVGPEEERRGEDPKAMLHAMDVEGIDVSIVFRTRAAHVIAVDGLDAELTTAVCRAFNNWLADFCSTNRARLKPAALLPVHDVKLAAVEVRRSVQELGAVALVLPNQQVNERPWYDQYYNPLWAEAEGLRVPVAFHGIQMAYQEHLGRRYLDNFAMAHAVGPSSGDDAGVGKYVDGRSVRTVSGIDRRLSGGALQLGAMVAMVFRRARREVRRRRTIPVKNASQRIFSTSLLCLGGSG